jgi:hypothetical protein
MSITEIARSPKAIAIVCAALILFQGCAAPPRMNPLPGELADQAEIPSMPGVRFWADYNPELAEFWLKLPEDELRAEFGGIMDREHNYLAISGGGANGAFGAG